MNLVFRIDKIQQYETKQINASMVENLIRGLTKSHVIHSQICLCINPTVIYQRIRHSREESIANNMTNPHIQNLMHLFIDLPIYKNLHQSRGGDVSGKGGLFGTPGQWVMHNISSVTRETLSDGLITGVLLSRSAYICAWVCYASVRAHLCTHTNLYAPLAAR